MTEGDNEFNKLRRLEKAIDLLLNQKEAQRINRQNIESPIKAASLFDDRVIDPDRLRQKRESKNNHS